MMAGNARSIKTARTRKKNSLVTCIDSANDLLADLLVPAHRLKDVQLVLKNNWEAYEEAQIAVEGLLDEDETIDVGQVMFEERSLFAMA